MKKIKDFDIKIGTTKYPKSTSTWITANKGLVYISWPTGRTYFKTNTIDYKNTIHNISFIDDKNTISFVWKGLWDMSLWGKSKPKNVIKSFNIKFNTSKDYNYIKKKWFHQ